MRMIIVVLTAMALAGCGGQTIYRDRPVTTLVPVAQPCATARPAPVVPLREQIPDAEWAELDVKQKAARVAAQGLDRMTYGENLAAATGACAEVE